MSAMYSKAFDHVSSGQNETDYTYSDPELDSNLQSRQRRGIGGRTSAFRIKSQEHIDNKSMGQDQSNPAYIDFNLPPGEQTSLPHGMSGKFTTRSDVGNHDDWVYRGHTHEDDEEYSYAYSKDVVQDEEVNRRAGLPPQRSVSIKDDYSQPPDRLSKTSNRTTSLDYAEPYHSQKGVNRNPTSPVIAHDPGDIYELAKNVSDGQPNLPVEGTYNHLEETTDTLGGVKLDPDTHLTQSYDHLESWNKRTTSVNSVDSGTSHYDSAETSPMKKTADISENVFATSSGKMPPSVYTDIPANYEEPWDSEEGKMRLSRIMNRAEKKDQKRQSVEHAPPMVTGGAVKQASNSGRNDTDSRIETQMLSNATNNVSDDSYEVAWAGTNLNQRKQSDKSARNNSPATQPVSHVTIPANYEDAWDLPEKQKEFEEKLQQARKQRASQGQIREAEDEIFSNPTEISRQRIERRGGSRQISGPPTSPTRVKREEAPMRSDSCRSLGALSEKIDKYIPLQEQNFYHGTIKRSEAEKLLVVFKEGSYLVRRSETSRQDYSLTLKGRYGLPMHMKISCKPDGNYILGENSPPFRTIPEMVDYYTTHELPVQNADRICLLYPIPS